MSISCLVADDYTTAEFLISQVVDIRNPECYIGVALYPEASTVFEKYGLKSIMVDDYITRIEHERNGIEASNFIFEINQKLDLEPPQGRSFHFERFDLLYGYHFVNYEIFGHIFYYLTTLSKILKETQPGKVYAVDLKKPLNLPVNQRPRSLLAKCLVKVCEREKVAIKLISAGEVNCEDSIPGLDPSYYKFSNNRHFLRLLGLIEKGFYNERNLERIARVFPERTTIKSTKSKSNPAILYVGIEYYFRKIIKKSPSNFISICLDYSDSQKGYFYERDDLIRTNMKFLVRNFLNSESKKSIGEYNIQTKKIYESIANNVVLKDNFCFAGICFYDIFLEYLKLYVDKAFSEELERYNAVKDFSKKFNVKFALDYSGWTTPSIFSVHKALKANGIHTAFLSHGMNIVNKNIAAIVRGDGTLYPCDIFFSPGTEMVKGHVENRLKDDKNNFVTGFPYYSTVRKINSSFLKFLIKKALGLNSQKKIVLYPLTKGSPHVNRPNVVTFVEEYNFVKKLIETFNNDDKFQLVVKSKHYTIPDKNYLKLFHDNYPNVVLRYGPLEYFLRITDVVINFNSSSGFDALLAKVPVIYFKPTDRHDWFDPYASRNGEKNFFLKAKTFEEIIAISRNIINGQFPEWYEEKMREVPEKFMISEGEEAANNIIEIIKKYLEKDRVNHRPQ